MAETSETDNDASTEGGRRYCEELDKRETLG